MRFSILILIMLSVTGAGSVATAASSNYPRAPKRAELLQQLKTKYNGRKACIDLGVSLPVKVDQQRGRFNGISYSPFDATLDDLKTLLRVGFLKRVNSSDQSTNAAAEQSHSGDKPLFPRSQPVKLALTSAGRSAASLKTVGRETYSRFCYGDYRVEKIINYSTPAADKNGRIVTTVKFGESIHDVAPWAVKIAKLQKNGDVKSALKTRTNPKIFHQGFISTANGWILESNF